MPMPLGLHLSRRDAECQQFFFDTRPEPAEVNFDIPYPLAYGLPYGDGAAREMAVSAENVTLHEFYIN